MKWLQTAKNSVILVDVLLVLAAIIAIIGLATFVRLNKSKAPAMPGSAETLSSAFEKAQALSAVNYGNPKASNPQTNPTNNGKVQGAHTNQDFTCEGNCNLSSNVLKEDNNLSCDESKKQLLMTKYNSAVEQENQQYNQEITSKQKLIGPLYPTINSLINSLEPEHQENLNNLYQELVKNLSDINCSI